MPLGRAADPLHCDDRRAPLRTPADCTPRRSRIGAPSPAEAGKLALDPDDRREPPPLPGEVPCARVGVILCGQYADGPYGSYALTCRDAQDQATGAARLVAPDGSVLVDGACDHGRAIGTWFRWEWGRLVSAVAIADDRAFGLQMLWDGSAYHYEVVPTGSTSAR